MFRDSLMVVIIKSFRVKLIFHQRGRGVRNYTEGNKWLRKYYLWIYKGADIICLSPQMIEDISNVSSGNIHVVPNGIPDIAEKFKEKFQSEGNKVLFLSNLIRSKGLFDLLEAIRILQKDRGIFVKLEIIGAGDEKEINALEKFIEENSLVDVTYHGALYNEDKYRILQQSDVMVFPTYYPVETFGTVIIEAMQFSIPIVSTNFSSIPFIIDDEKTGFLVEINNPFQIANRLELLLHDSELRGVMGDRARLSYEKRFTFSTMESKLAHVFSNCLSELC